MSGPDWGMRIRCSPGPRQAPRTPARDCNATRLFNAFGFGLGCGRLLESANRCGFDPGCDPGCDPVGRPAPQIPQSGAVTKSIAGRPRLRVFWKNGAERRRMMPGRVARHANRAMSADHAWHSVASLGIAWHRPPGNHHLSSSSKFDPLPEEPRCSGLLPHPIHVFQVPMRHADE